MKNRTVKVDVLARVEGEGSLCVKIKEGRGEAARLDIFEPPRFFEALLRGRHFSEAPDITARICGICPVAYQMSACHALENAFGARVEGPLRDLRRLFYCGEWIESHALHVYFLHAPDFLGHEDAFALAKTAPEAVERGLRLKKCGNDVMTLLAGREIHPVNVRVGGFYRAPAEAELKTLADDLAWALDAAVETFRWTLGLPFPEFDDNYEFVALTRPDEYPLNEGRLISNRGLDIAADEYERHFAEEHVEHSNALHSVLKARGAYQVGPLARVNLNVDRLSGKARAEAARAGLVFPITNPFKSILARGLELIFACEEALRIVHEYREPPAPAVALLPRASEGAAITEAPRGILYHRYRVDGQGLITDAKIVPPTAQNQKTIEADLRRLVERNLTLNETGLARLCEHAIRNYDPCISCATHFLKLKIERSAA